MLSSNKKEQIFYKNIKLYQLAKNKKTRNKVNHNKFNSKKFQKFIPFFIICSTNKSISRNTNYKYIITQENLLNYHQIRTILQDSTQNSSFSSIWPLQNIKFPPNHPFKHKITKFSSNLDSLWAQNQAKNPIFSSQKSRNTQKVAQRNQKIPPLHCFSHTQSKITEPHFRIQPDRNKNKKKTQEKPNKSSKLMESEKLV